MKALPFLLLVPMMLDAQDLDYERLKPEAERLHAEGSYARAHDLYVKADSLALPAAEERWVDFRIADTLWRSQAATQNADRTRLENAEAALQKLIRDRQRPEEKDLVYAEVEESLGDFHWARRQGRNFGAAWPHYQAALTWWGSSKDVERARERYLKIIGKAASPPWREPYAYYGYYGNQLPLEVLENAREIAASDEDRARTSYLVAMTLRNHGGDPYASARVAQEFEAAMRLGKSTDWYDDAVYFYAEWLMNQGRLIIGDDGSVRTEPDYVKALELFRHLIESHQKGETRYYDQAKNHIEQITRPSVAVGVPNFFIPGAEVEYHLNWRNVTAVDLTLWKVDLTRDLNFSAAEDRSLQNWVSAAARKEKARSWKHATGDQGDYRPGAASLRLDDVAPGAYVLEAAAGGTTAADLVLVTDAALLLKGAGTRAVAFFADAASGAPIPGGRVHLWQRVYDGSRWHLLTAAKETDADGLATFDLPPGSTNIELFAGARIGERQAFSTGDAYRQDRDASWRVYAFTDRPAYRPGDKAEWKVIVRRHDGEVYSTPARETVDYEIHDPRGAKAAEGKLVLNAFGAAWASLELTEAMPLGEYQVQFTRQNKKEHIGGAVLFRLEEYKLPEFKVAVKTPEEDGKRKSFRLGERIEAEIAAEYYFGGPVADAEVQVLVYQNPFYLYWQRHRDYPWYYEDFSPWHWRHRGQGQVMKQETVRTDSEGKARISFETPRGHGQDLEFRIEARVTDSSRREIVGQGTVRVTRQRYYVEARADRNLYRPEDKVRVTFKAQDANSEPVEAEGTVKVVRSRWVEVWLDEKGKEVRDDALREAHRSPTFPPAGWRLKFRGYEHEDILTQAVKTSREGDGELAFTAPRAGYYRVSWLSRDQDGMPIRAETVAWVLTPDAAEIGYRTGGIEVVIDKDTFRAGETAPVMLAADAPGRFVLFAIEGEVLHEVRLVRMEGSVKLLEIPVAEKHVPNVHLSAAMFAGRELHLDTKQVIVPPVKHFITLDVKPDRADYLPRDEGSLTVTALDHQGKPVEAEVAVSLIDESITYIQSEYAGDPRQFFYGDKRPLLVRTESMLNYRSFARPEDRKKDQLADAQEKESENAATLFSLDKKKEFSRRGAMALSEARAGAPAPAAEALLSASRDESKLGRADAAGLELDAGLAGAGGKNVDEPAVVVRTDFRATAAWEPAVVTGKDGKATVKVKFPDSLTTWKATARGATSANQFGTASASARTRLPLIVRLQAPRFFVAGDEAVVSAVVHNNTDRSVQVAASLAAEGLELVGWLKDGKAARGEPEPLVIEANGEARADWLVRALKPGPVRLKAAARSDRHADAMEKTYEVHEHGVEKLLAKSGKLRGDTAVVKMDLPERKPGSTSLVVQVAPSLAVTMLDALPYLADYPYGCTEQTMSRFLPAAITANTLKDLKLDPSVVAAKLFGGIEQATADKTHPGGKKDLRKLDEMAQAGISRLYNFQHADGGWGWWQHGESDHFMTAYVVWGLTLARGAGLDIKPDVIARGAEFLAREVVEEEDNPDMAAWILHALAVQRADAKAKMSEFEAKAFQNLLKKQDGLNAYTRALFALAAHHYGKASEARVLARNLENGVKVDERPDTSVLLEGERKSQEGVLATAHWGEDGVWWRWSDGGVEATAFAVRALLAIDPESKLIEPAVNWLIKGRRGAQWSNTRDTAVTVLALNEYLRKSGETAPEVAYEVLVNGERVVEKKVTPAEALEAPSRFTIDARFIRETANEVRIVRRGGQSPLYFGVEARFFSREEPVTPAGNEIFVRRDYVKLVPAPTLLAGYVSDRFPLADGGKVRSGERVEVTLTVEAKNNYEYLVFEDLKPAGFEAVEVRSGAGIHARELKSGAVEREAGRRDAAAAPGAAPAAAIDPSDATRYTGRSRWVYQELRDRKVALFLDQLPEGVWEIRYELRAETPGKFHGLPVLGHAMYVPEIRANGAETRVEVEDAPPEPARRMRRAVVGAK